MLLLLLLALLELRHLLLLWLLGPGHGRLRCADSLPQQQPAQVQLCQGHCPVQHVAAEFPEFCDAETEAFSELLGVHVQRLATLAQGDHVCTTFVPGAAAPGATTEERSQS